MRDWRDTKRWLHKGQLEAQADTIRAQEQWDYERRVRGIYELDPNAAVEAQEQVQHVRARRLIWPAVVALILLIRVVTLNSCIREEHFRPKELR